MAPDFKHREEALIHSPESTRIGLRARDRMGSDFRNGRAQAVLTVAGRGLAGRYKAQRGYDSRLRRGCVGLRLAWYRSGWGSGSLDEMRG